MSDKNDSKHPGDTSGRVAWFDESTHTSLIANHAERLQPFLDAVAQGDVDEGKLHAQEARVVDLMQRIEPMLEPALHDKVTELLRELTAYDIMRAMHRMHEALAEIDISRVMHWLRQTVKRPSNGEP